jgi:hypothetical protein
MPVNIALTQIAGKSAMSFFGSTKINPQAIHDLTSAPDNFKINTDHPAFIHARLNAHPFLARRKGSRKAT